MISKDFNLGKGLLLIGAILGAAIAFYYVASPYQNCMRDMSEGDGGFRSVASFCSRNSTW